MNGAYRVALTCGAAPLFLGVSIFLLWLLTRWSWLGMAGLVTLYCGVGLFVVGCIALASFGSRAFRTPGMPRRRAWLSILGCAALLLSNFPVAGGIVAAAMAIETRYTVVIRNTSQQPLDAVRVIGGGSEASFGSIPPGGAARRSLWFREGDLRFRAISGTITHDKSIQDYVSNGMGGHATVTINPDGTISVTGSQGW